MDLKAKWRNYIGAVVVDISVMCHRCEQPEMMSVYSGGSIVISWAIQAAKSVKAVWNKTMIRSIHTIELEYLIWRPYSFYCQVL